MLKLKDLLAAILQTDLVIESGTDSNWTYKKYASGRLEAERVWNVGQVTLSTTVSSTWKRGGTINIATPPMMISGSVSASLMGDSSNSAIVLEHISNTSFAIAKETSVNVTLQNVTLALRTIEARWK